MQRKTRRLLVVPLAVLVVGGAVAGGIAVAGDATPSPSGGDAAATATGTTTTGPSPSAPTTAGAGVSTSPAAPTTVAADSPAPAARQTVPVMLAYADWDAQGKQVEAAGFVAGVVETGGVCALELTRTGEHAEATRDAEADASMTNCGSLAVPADQLSVGEWSATLSYRSATSSGTSEPMTVTVPAR